MKIAKIQLLAAILCWVLTAAGCADENSGGSSAITKTEPVTTKSTEAASEVSSETKQSTFLADIISYKEDQLTYIHDGETCTGKMMPELFANDTWSRRRKQLSQRIINNRYGISVKGYIKLSSDGGIASCDVISVNGESFNSDSLREFSEDDYLHDMFRMKRVSGSVYEFSNSTAAFTADLNDLDDRLKGDFGDGAENVQVTGYRFRSGELIVDSVAIYDHSEVTNVGTQHTFSFPTCEDKYSFFGKIQSLSEGRATVLLNDGKTTCDVPTYYNDGELSEGQQVLVILEAESSLYGSGEQYKADYAVFITHLEQYGGEEHDFSKLAYAQPSKQRADTTVLTFADGTTKGFTYTLPTKFSFTASE